MTRDENLSEFLVDALKNPSVLILITEKLRRIDAKSADITQM